MLLPGQMGGLMLILQDLQPDTFLLKEFLSVIQGILLFNVRAIVSRPNALINVFMSHRFTSNSGFSHILSRMVKTSLTTAVKASLTS